MKKRTAAVHGLKHASAHLPFESNANNIRQMQDSHSKLPVSLITEVQPCLHIMRSACLHLRQGFGILMCRGAQAGLHIMLDLSDLSAQILVQVLQRFMPAAWQDFTATTQARQVCA